MQETIETTGKRYTNTQNPLRVEDWIYLVALGLAVLMRIVMLGTTLTEWEAGFTWQAYQVSQGDAFSMLSHPGYILPTGLLFFLFGSGEVLARLLPALVGSAVVLLPYAFREQIGKKAALIAAFGLALDPLMVAYARQAGSPAMALGLVALVLFCYRKEKLFLAGLFAGWALLSGPSLVFGILTLLLGWGLLALLGNGSLSFSLGKKQWSLGLAGMLAAVLIFGTLLMRYPQGLAAMFQAIPDYLAGILRSDAAASGAPLIQVLGALPIYQPLALLLAFLGFFKMDSIERPLTVFLLGSLLGSLLLIAVDPARQVWMLLWMIAPLWLLAGQEVAAFFSAPEKEDQMIVIGEGIFFFILLLYWWTNLSKMSSIYFISIPEGTNLLSFNSLDANTKVYFVRLAVTIIIPVLIVLISTLIGNLWVWKKPWQGAIWGVSGFLALYLLMTTWNFTAQPSELAGELWIQGPSEGNVTELMTAIEEASVQITGTRDEIQLIYQIDSSLLHWLLRDFPNSQYSAVPIENELPEAVLNRETDNGENLVSQFYRGEQITLQINKSWGQNAFPSDFDRWLIYRQGPLEYDWVTFWRRSDLFPLYSPAESE